MAGSLRRWIHPALVILLAVAGPLNSAGSGPTTSTGVQVTESVPFARESIDEIRALAPMLERTVPESRAIPLRRIQRRSGATGDPGLPFSEATVAAPSVSSSPALSAPALDGSFAGLGNPPHFEGDVVPPDTMGAAGPSHLVGLMNSDFGVFNKSGTLLQKVPLQTFWASLGTAAGEPADFPFDPKILYDQHSGRFVAITLGGKSAPASWVMIAVSSTSDPTGTWSKWAIDADREDGVQTSNSADFPGLGVDAFNVYVTANMFSGTLSRYSKVWVIPKAQLLEGSNPITRFEFFPPYLPGSDFTMQPAHTFGTPGAEYFLYEGSSNRLAVAWIDNTSGTPVWHAPLQVPVIPYTSTSFLPGAPQLGNDNTIDTSDTRLLNAVYRNGSVWTTHHLGVNGKVEVAWYRIHPGTGAVQSQGRINHPNRWYYYPSIGVNQDNVAAVGFSGSSTTEYVGGYYTIVQPSSGTAEPLALLKAGEAPYWKTLGGTENRWGDFSATMVDPTDDVTFWTLQEYAQTPDPATGSSRWGTWWGKFHPSDVLSPTGVTATTDNATQVTLRWTDPATNETGYVVERKVGAAGTFGVLTSPPLPPNSVTYTDNVGLAAGTTYYYRVGALGLTGTSYSIEVSVTTPGSPPSSGGGGGCMSITRSGGEASFGTSLFSAGILLLPVCALGLRRFFLRREKTVPIRHPLC
ncbi:MAG: fibronectin type III domain-containing protein [Deltaproteobacteria bacterium]|nr:fibronectin type III domain-containing protein [Deltaproteobacteria bacterium]